MYKPLRKMNFLVAIFPFILMFSAGSAIAAETEALENGKETFEEFCAACHGFDGIRQVKGVPSFAKGESLEKPDAELLEVIKKGKGDVMPPWGEAIDEKMMANVLAYIRTLKRL